MYTKLIEHYVLCLLSTVYTKEHTQSLSHVDMLIYSKRVYSVHCNVVYLPGTVYSI